MLKLYSPTPSELKTKRIMSYLIKQYLTIDQNFFKNISLQNPFSKKEELFTILKWWKTLSKSETIGDLTKINGNTPLIKIKLGSSVYAINADTTKQGIQTFLSNKNNSWKVIENENGELLLEFPVELLNQMGWHEDTILEWLTDEEDSVILKEKECQQQQESETM